MSHHFKLLGLPAIILMACLFLGWPFLLGVPVPDWLAVLHWIAWPFIAAATVAIFAAPIMGALFAVAGAIMAMFRLR